MNFFHFSEFSSIAISWFTEDKILLMTHITGTFYSIKLQKMVDLEDIQVETFPDSCPFKGKNGLHLSHLKWRVCERSVNLVIKSIKIPAGRHIYKVEHITDLKADKWNWKIISWKIDCSSQNKLPWISTCICQTWFVFQINL